MYVSPMSLKNPALVLGNPSAANMKRSTRAHKLEKHENLRFQAFAVQKQKIKKHEQMSFQKQKDTINESRTQECDQLILAKIVMACTPSTLNAHKVI